MTSSQCSRLSQGPDGGIPAEQTSASSDSPQTLRAAVSTDASPASPTSISAPSTLAALRSMPTTRQPCGDQPLDRRAADAGGGPGDDGGPLRRFVHGRAMVTDRVNRCAGVRPPGRSPSAGGGARWRRAHRRRAMEPRRRDSPRTWSSERTSTYGVRSSTLRCRRGLRSSSRWLPLSRSTSVLGPRPFCTQGLGDAAHRLIGAGKAGIARRDDRVGDGQPQLDVVDDRAEERPLAVRRLQLNPTLGAVTLEVPRQRRSDAVPGRQVRAALGPREGPWNGAQRRQRWRGCRPTRRT